MSNDSILFGKYRLERVIGRGGASTVYLATHLVLDEKRAIKRISKASQAYSRFRQEGLIMKSIRHPGIPIVYDFEEDESYGYLIEEYLEGDSLFDIVREQGALSAARTVSIGIQICHLVHHLHSARANPILYLDLQPKNLLLCRGTVKLVDFGRAALAGETGGAVGTPGCAAPEQYAGEVPDERTDVYGVGAVLYFLRTGEYAPTGEAPAPPPRAGGGGIRSRREKRLRRIIRKCLEKRREKRYPTVEALERALRRSGPGFSGTGGIEWGERPFPVVVGVAGNGRGVGVTHLSIGLAAYLRDQNVTALYVERVGSGTVRELLRCFHRSLNRFGCAAICGIDFQPYFKGNVRLEEGNWQVLIKDLGTDGWRQDGEWDVLVWVRGGKWWNPPGLDGPAATVTVRNLSLRRLGGRREMEGELAAPWFENPFFPPEGAEAFYRRLWETCGLPGRGEVSSWKRTAGRILCRVRP